MTAILKTTDVNKQFGGLAAVTALNVDVQPGEIIGLIGPNGAGKTTSFNLITGVYKPTSGKIEFCGTNITGMKPHAITKLGVARTFQNIRLFKEMSVVENLLVAQHMQVNRNLLAGVLNTPAYRRAESDALDRAFYWLEVVDLVDCANRLAGEMSYGQQRRLEIARAMCTGPEILCLDEPAAGLNPVETLALSKKRDSVW